MSHRGDFTTGTQAVYALKVTNTGAVGGDEVVEAYLTTPQAGGPIRSLVGFERVTLAPGGQPSWRAIKRRVVF